MTSIDNTLAERGKRYGEFPTHAEITQGLKEVMWATPNWKALADDQKEALEMTAHKIGRILNGDPNYIDSWTDIGGYIRLVEKRLMDAEVAHLNKAQSKDMSAQEVNGVEDGLDELNLFVELVESIFGKPAAKPAPEPDEPQDALEKKLTAILKQAFGDNVEIHHVRGQGS